MSPLGTTSQPTEAPLVISAICSQGQVTEQPSLGGMTDALHKTRTAISFPNSEKRHEREQSRGRQPDGDGDGDRDSILTERHDMRDEQTSEGPDRGTGLPVLFVYADYMRFQLYRTALAPLGYSTSRISYTYY